MDGIIKIVNYIQPIRHFLSSSTFLCVYSLINESPRWLIVSGRFDDALRILRRAARINKTVLPPEDEIRTMMLEIKKEVDAILVLHQSLMQQLPQRKH